MTARLARKGTLIGELLRLPLRFLPPRAVLPVVSGPLRGVRWVVGSGTHGCWIGSYERKKVEHFAEALSPGMVVYDVGANVGLYTLLASRLVGPSGRVVAFEPLPRNLEFLRRHVDLNGCPNVTVIPAAAGVTSGWAKFDTGEGPFQGKLSESGTLDVETVTLDGVREARGIPKPDVLKVDVEGAEAFVLEGAVDTLTSARPMIYLSTHGSHVHLKCLELLASAEYQVRSLDGRPAANTDEVIAFHRP